MQTSLCVDGASTNRATECRYLFAEMGPVELVSVEQVFPVRLTFPFSVCISCLE